jgi:hypothetical protein
MDFSGMDPKDARKAQRGWDLAQKHRIEQAAPEMLSVLEALVNVQADGDYYAVADEARAVIAKARGTTVEDDMERARR